MYFLKEKNLLEKKRSDIGEEPIIITEVQLRHFQKFRLYKPSVEAVSNCKAEICSSDGVDIAKLRNSLVSIGWLSSY